METQEVKNFRVTGFYSRQKRRFHFTKYVRALDKEKALEKVFSNLNVGKKRREINITKIKEIEPPQITNERLKKIAGREKPSILGR